MKATKMKTGLLILFLVLGSIAAGLSVIMNSGVFLGEEFSPDRAYSLRYYRSFNPFRMIWRMPGSSVCKPRWIRLYDKDGTQLNELSTTDCAFENPTYWFHDEVVLPDGVTVWRLPQKV